MSNNDDISLKRVSNDVEEVVDNVDLSEKMKKIIYELEDLYDKLDDLHDDYFSKKNSIKNHYSARFFKQCVFVLFNVLLSLVFVISSYNILFIMSLFGFVYSFFKYKLDRKNEKMELILNRSSYMENKKRLEYDIDYLQAEKRNLYSDSESHSVSNCEYVNRTTSHELDSNIGLNDSKSRTLSKDC